MCRTFLDIHNKERSFLQDLCTQAHAQTSLQRVCTSRGEEGWRGCRFFTQVEPNWPLPSNVPVPWLRDATPAGWVTYCSTVYARVHCREPKTGQKKVHFYCKDDWLWPSCYYLNIYLCFAPCLRQNDFQKVVTKPLLIILFFSLFLLLDECVSNEPPF